MRLTPLLLIIALIAILSSCSKSDNPIVTQEIDNNSLSEMISSADDMKVASNHQAPFGIWQLNINKDNLEAELLPARNAVAIGDFFDSDLSQFLTVSPCANCLQITGVSVWSDYFLNIEMSMRHPFENIYQRPDLHGFDVRAIFIAGDPFSDDPGFTVAKPDGSTEPAEFGNRYLANADGYTSHFSHLINDERYFIHHEPIDGNLFPFLRFYDGFSMGDFDPDLPVGYNVMPVASAMSSRTASFDLDIVKNSTAAIYVIADVAFGQAATFQNRQNPDYFLPAFNRTEPWRIEYWYENNELDSSAPNSTADLMIQVFDWQHDFEVDPDYPDTENLSGIPESSKVLGVRVNFPSMMSSMIESSSPDAGNGKPNNPIRYRIPVKNELGATIKALGYVAVYDELYGRAAPSGRSPIPESPAGFPYGTVDIRDYAYYQVIYANIPFNNGVRDEFDNELKIDPETRYVKYSTARILPEFFMDRSGSRFLYEWDFDYDGVTFDVDLADWYGEIDLSKEGINNVGLRITTNTIPPQEYIYNVKVYRRGIQLDDNLLNYNSGCSSSMMRNHAIAIGNDKCYLAYVARNSNRWNVALISFDNYGDFDLKLVTEADDESFMQPSMAIVESGPDEGIYLAFIRLPDSGGIDTFSSFGGLNFSGFNEINIKPVAEAPMKYEYYPVIKYFNGELLIYYMDYQAPNSHIMVARSADMGLTWSDHTLVDSSGDLQYRPTVTLNGNKAYCVWEDTRNAAISGVDLLMAESMPSDLMTFNSPINISPTANISDEMYAQICSAGESLFIAYLEKLPGENPLAHVQLRNLSNGMSFDEEIYVLPYFPHTQPSIDAVFDNQCVLAYGAYDTLNDVLKTSILELVYENYEGHFQQKSLINRDAGNIEDLGAETFPCVKSRICMEDKVVETFVVHRNFDNGFNKQTSPALAFFGDLNFFDFITKGTIDD